MTKFAEVILPLPLPQSFYYSVPQKCLNQMKVGVRVIVPLRKRKLTGIVINLVDSLSPNFSIGCKEIEEVLDGEPILPKSILQLTRKLSEEYFAPWGEFIRISLPPSLLLKSVTKIYLTDKAKDQQFIRTLSRDEKKLLNFIGEKSYSLTYLRRRFKDLSPLLAKLRKKGFIESKDEFKKIIRRRVCNYSAEEFYQLELSGLLTQEERLKISRVLDVLQEQSFASFLLFADHEKRFNIYLELIKKTLREGRKVIYLLPEITLTESVVRNLRKKINGRITILHSELTEKQRESLWLKIRDNKFDVIVGSRSAIFSPFSELGLIIIDQEEDESYFQKDYPFYDVRRAAFFRAEIEKAVLVSGSIAPSVESFYHAHKNKNLIIFPSDRNKISSFLTVFDPKKEKNVIGSFLEAKIRKKLLQREKIIIFINKKGYAQFFVCKNCGHLLRCQKCSSPLINSHRKGKVICNTCHYFLPKPRTCPLCNGEIRKIWSIGTGLVEKELRALFPQTKIARFDSEGIKNKRLRAKAIKDFNQGKIEILVGTQLLAYCEDLNQISLIGILFPENMLGFPDYKAGERTFQILQRLVNLLAENGEVLIQTSFPENYIICAIQKFDYLHFYQEEIKFRELFEYPPFTYIGEIIFSGKNLRKLAQHVRDFSSRIKTSNLDVKILEPIVLPQTSGKFRLKIILKAMNKKILKDSVKNFLPQDIKRSEISIYI